MKTKTPTKRALILLGLIAVIGITLAFISIKVEKTENNMDSGGFAILELFISEGCGKCPAAEAILEKIQKENLANEVYILTYHIDYWDIRGWKDPFADARFSTRQHQYANWLAASVYTPQLVVNGKDQFVGSDEAGIKNAIKKETNKNEKSSLILDCRIDKGKLYVKYTGAKEARDTELVLVLIQKEGESKVIVGQNGGRTLRHIQIARDIVSQELDGRKNAMLDLPANFYAEDGGWELIGFTQNKGSGHINQVAKYDLAKLNK